MWSNREREQVHELIKQARIHPANHYQQDAVVIHVEEGEYIPTVVAAFLQLEHAWHQPEDNHAVCEGNIYWKPFAGLLFKDSLHLRLVRAHYAWEVDGYV